LLAQKSNIALIGDDLDPKRKKYCRVNLATTKKGAYLEQADILHICIPYSKTFAAHVLEWTNKYSPREIVIHSTVVPGTTEKVQASLPDKIVVYSPIRGVHSRMLMDIQRYAKFWACGLNCTPSLYLKTLDQCGLKKARMSSTEVLELAKIYVDTTYLGWLIIYAQHTKEVCESRKVDWDEMWQFSDEIHKFLKNRPKMFPGEGIGGHCVLPNLELIQDEFLEMVFAHDKHYRKRFQ
jgi:UDP-N-acetyl-D-mannosaminuronate dehydrogenase